MSAVVSITEVDQHLASVARLKRDLAKASVTMSHDEVRFLVDAYYQMQKNRMRSKAQSRTLAESDEPHDVLRWLGQQNEVLEQQIQRSLDKWTDGQRLGRWCKSITGIGPVITAGLMAHIDIEKAPTVGHIYNFAGLNPKIEWSKGQKRPWNSTLKTLCWKIGESFVKVSNNPNDVYGKLYQQRREYEDALNASGAYADQAAEKLRRFRIGDDTVARGHYEKGKLPPGHLHARAKRWAVKLFLSHYHETAYRLHYGKAPAEPYPIAFLGHAHRIDAPPMVD